MSSEIELQKFEPASIIVRSVYEDKITKGQRLLLNLMQERISAKQPITLDDIKSVYYDSVNRNGWLNHYDYGTGNRTKKRSKKEWVEDCWSKERSITWFKSNIGACVLKGKLLVIPVIELEDTKLIEK